MGNLVVRDCTHSQCGRARSVVACDYAACAQRATGPGATERLGCASVARRVRRAADGAGRTVACGWSAGTPRADLSWSIPLLSSAERRPVCPGSPRLTLDAHLEMGRVLAGIRDEFAHRAVQRDAVYPSSGPEGVPHRKVGAALRALDEARSASVVPRAPGRPRAHRLFTPTLRTAASSSRHPAGAPSSRARHCSAYRGQFWHRSARCVQPGKRGARRPPADQAIESAKASRWP